MPNPPSPESRSPVERLFAEALDRDPSERIAWLEGACEDPELRAETLRLLHAHDTAGDFLSGLDTQQAAALVRASPGPDLARVGPYRVIRLLARGGMGIVYLARDDRLGRHVALKCLPAWLEPDDAARARFIAEARAASALDHPNIATVHDVGETPEGGLFIAMSFYEGETLAERIGRGPLEPGDALTIAAQVADGLAAAHANGIVHRDIKPGNVLVTAGGLTKILDFGIAKTEGGRTTRAGQRLGTVGYMSPEQTRGEPVDARTDVWSFGALLYEMLAGRRPFRGENDAVVIHAIRHDDPPAITTVRPDVPDAVARVIERCLEKDPARRYADARQLRADLDAGVGADEGDIEVAARGAARRAKSASPPVRPADPASGPARSGPWAALRGGVRRLAAAPAAVAWTAGLIVALALAAAGVVWFAQADAASSEASGGLDPNLVVVLPFAAAPHDSALRRLGHDLVITLSANLNGLGLLRTVDGSTVAARATSWERDGSLAAGRALARELNAGRVVHGSLVRDGDDVLAHIAVYRAPGEAPDVRATATASAGDIRALTDSVTWSLVRRLWPSERTPSVEPTALSTRSLPALRAFLEGELATAEGRWREAPDHFAVAIERDSTFWLAYARYVAAMDYRSRPVDPAIREIVRTHRSELPEIDRALIEAGMAADSLSERLALARAVTERFPHSWRAWFALADQLIHNGMFLGATLGEARAAIERTVALNPASGTLWQHAFWMALKAHDTAAAGVALQRLADLGYDSATLREVGLDELAFFRYVLGFLSRAGTSNAAGRVSPSMTAGSIELAVYAAADSLAAPLIQYSGPLDLERISGHASVLGSHRAELVLDEAVLDLPVPASARAGALRSSPQALAGRGAWGAAMEALETYVAQVESPAALQYAVRLAVVGAWLGALEPGAGATWRAALERYASRLDFLDRIDLAWLDGIAAFARSDEGGLAAARGRLAAEIGALRERAGGEREDAGGERDARSERSVAVDSTLASYLDRSLAAFQLAQRGRPSEAADAMLELERMRAERYAFRYVANSHPYFTAVNRLAAADWLLATGRAAEAAPLLRWHQSVRFPSDVAARADASLRGLIHFRRGRVEQALGRMDLARPHFRRALGELDRPVDRLRPLLDSARAALVR